MEQEYTYEDEIRITSDFLGQIDILSYVPNRNNGYTIEDLMRNLEKDYENTGKVPNDDFFEGLLFNRMNACEFEEYLCKRYKHANLYMYQSMVTYLMKNETSNNIR